MRHYLNVVVVGGPDDGLIIRRMMADRPNFLRPYRKQHINDFKRYGLYRLVQKGEEWTAEFEREVIEADLQKTREP